MTRLLPLARLGSALDQDEVDYVSELYPDGVIVSQKLLSELLDWDRGEADGMFNRLYPLILDLLSPSELKEVTLLSIQNRWQLVGEALDDHPDLLAQWAGGPSNDVPQTVDDAMGALPLLRAIAEALASDNTASVAGMIGSASGICAYNVSKHVELGPTRTAALEYAWRGIRVNAVCPAFVTTPNARYASGR